GIQANRLPRLGRGLLELARLAEQARHLDAYLGGARVEPGGLPVLLERGLGVAVEAGLQPEAEVVVGLRPVASDGHRGRRGGRNGLVRRENESDGNHVRPANPRGGFSHVVPAGVKRTYVPPKSFPAGRFLAAFKPWDERPGTRPGSTPSPAWRRRRCLPSTAG